MRRPVCVHRGESMAAGDAFRFASQAVSQGREVAVTFTREYGWQVTVYMPELPPAPLELHYRHECSCGKRACFSLPALRAMIASAVFGDTNETKENGKVHPE